MSKSDDGGCWNLKTCENNLDAASCEAFEATGSLTNCCCRAPDATQLSTCKGKDLSPTACAANLHPPDDMGYSRKNYCIGGALETNSYTTADECCCFDFMHHHKHNKQHKQINYPPASPCINKDYTGKDCEKLSPSSLSPSSLGTINPRTCKVENANPLFDYTINACCERFWEVGDANDVRADACIAINPTPASSPAQTLFPVPGSSPAQGVMPTQGLAPTQHSSPTPLFAPAQRPSPTTRYSPPPHLIPTPGSKGGSKGQSINAGAPSHLGGTSGRTDKGHGKGSIPAKPTQPSHPATPLKSSPYKQQRQEHHKAQPMQQELRPVRTEPHLPMHPYMHSSETHAARSKLFSETYLRD